MKNELLRNTLIIGAGRIMTQFLGLLLLPIYTRFLTPGEYGTSDLIITYASLVMPFVTLSLEQGAFRLLVDARNNDEQKTYIFSFAIRVMLLLTLILWIVALVVAPYFDIDTRLTIVSLFYASCSIGLSSCLWFARGLGGNLEYAKGSVCVGLSTVILSLLFIVGMDLGAEGLLMSMALANLVGIVYFATVFRLPQYVNFRAKNKDVQSEMLGFSLPLIPNGISWWLVNVLNRTVIAVFLGVTATGIFAVSAKFPAVLTGLFSVFWISWHESASLHVQSDDRDSFFSNVTNSMIVVFGCIGLVLLASLSTIFDYVVQDSFRQSYQLIPILMIAALFNAISTFYGSIYAAMKSTRQILNTTMIAALVNIILLFSLIQTLDIYAAAIATVAGHLSMLIYRHIDLRRYVEISIDIRKLAPAVVAAVLVVSLYYVNNPWLNLVNLCIAGIATLLMNWSILISVKEIIWSRLRS